MAVSKGYKSSGSGDRSHNRRGGNDGASLHRLIEKEGKRFPCYLLHGRESYERDAVSGWLENAIRPREAPDFNVSVFHGDSLDPQNVVDAYLAYPVMAAQRLIVIRSCEKLSADRCRALEPLVKTPVDTSVVLAIGERVDLRRAFFKGIKQNGYGIEFKPPYDNQIPQWIARQAARSGIQLEPEAVEVLRLYVGNSLVELASEIDKLATFSGEARPSKGTRQAASDSEPKPTLTRELVEKHVGLSRQTNIFELTDAVGEGRRSRALELTRSLLVGGEQPVRIVAMLSRHLQILLRTKHLEQQRLPVADLARSLGVAPYFLSGYRSQARELPVNVLWHHLSRLLAVDAQIKSCAKAEQRTALECCLCEITDAAVPPLRSG